MRRTVLSVLMLSIVYFPNAQDLPSPTSNLQTLPTGSYIIAMDNSLQTNTAGDFNLKTYGLAVYLLNNNVKLKWVIRAGKIKDGIDFSGTAEQFQPTLIAGGTQKDFKGGPFVISSTDTAGVSSLITNFYTAYSLTGNNRPKVYRLTASAVADIRYDLTGYIPKAGILNDGGNQNIHIGYMTNASIPTANYSTSTATDLLIRCYTFASEAHSTNTDNALISTIKAFVTYGGNFLAQCEAIDTYENSAYGHLQTTNGIHVSNTNVNTSSVIFPNADLSFSQFDGIFDINYGGSVKNWTLASGSTFANNEHNHATGGTIGAQSPLGASVSKLNAVGAKGGLVFYLGSHNFSSVTAIESINGIRMYLNAFLTPVAINSGCQTGTQQVPLAVNLLNFQGNLINDKLNLEWKIADNEKIQRFEVEKSFDGKNFVTADIVSTTNKTGTEIYNLNKIVNTPGRIFYRLKIHDRSQVMIYSNILAFQTTTTPGKQLQVLDNATNDKITFSFNTEKNTPLEIKVYDIAGRLQMKQTMAAYRGNNSLSISVSTQVKPGMYVLEINNGVEKQTAKFVKH